MSHELRTPLNVVIGYTSSMLSMPHMYDYEKLPEVYARDIQLIMTNGQHLLGLINDILDLSKIEAGKLELEKVRMDPRAILNEVGLGVEVVLANDPFFGRGGRVMAASQKEQDLKHEFTIGVASDEKPTAIGSTNCHMDYFGKTFDIQTSDGETAHSACIGFGLERVTLALFKHHGLDPDRWPQEVKNTLGL